ncbi:uncharacterized transmembrane protein DDB_G0289901-like [Prorops nasuta]|uniref:uncharacterized transmembrane protein DDB_G0289901-like n=1 Tax=Prorops nasuta TaxID=863751 RepID=UPI0034CFABCD
MRLIVQLGLLALALSQISCREIRNSEKVLRYRPIKGKRGTGDYSMSYGSAGSSYQSPIISSSGYSLGGSSSGHGNLQNLGGGGIGLSHGLGGYSLQSSATNVGSGYGLQLGSGLSHGIGLQAFSLGAHGPQASYSLPVTLGSGSSQNLFTATKTGPVTFGNQGGATSSQSSGYSQPIYATGMQGLSAYGGGSSGSISVPVAMATSHGASYSLPTISLQPSSGSSGYIPITSGSHGPITGGLLIATGSPSGYSHPFSSGASHGISGLSGTSHGTSGITLAALSTGSHGASSGYTLPVSSGSGYSLSSQASHSDGQSGYSVPSSSSSYSSPKALSSGSSDSSGYSLPQTSSSYSSGSSSSGSYSGYSPDSSSSYSSGGSSGYSSPSSYSSGGSSSYSSPSSYSSGGGSSYSDSSSSYSPSSSHSNPSVTYATTNSAPSYSSSASNGYSSSYSSPSYSSQSEVQGSYSNLNPTYVGFSAAKLFGNLQSGRPKYDTISYSSPLGKY